jgi:UPF0716 family protein affecting phage T7 exclusion
MRLLPFIEGPLELVQGLRVIKGGAFLIFQGFLQHLFGGFLFLGHFRPITITVKGWRGVVSFSSDVLNRFEAADQLYI